ncbi:putative exported protein [Burkholderia mallei]|nr:putative exported protein [Burkholderia mallei]
MTERAIRKIGQWAAGVTCALAAVLVFAQPPHGGGPGFGEARIGVNGYRQRWGLRPTPSYGRYAAQSPYRPISAEARPAPHASGPGNVPMRAGSIRADVARYNEERGGRPAPAPRQDDSQRLPFFAPFSRN